MSRKDLIRLFLLGSIWGSSFLFMRILAPSIGALLTVSLRLSISGLALLIGLKLTGFDFEWKRFWKQYTITGLVNSALPFSLYAYAALHMPASYLAILNSTTPLFGVVFSALWMDEKLNLQKIIGLVMGSAGVALVAGTGASVMDSHYLSAALACLLGSACYAIAAIYIKKSASEAKPAGMATCAQLAAALFMTPTFLNFPPVAAFTPLVVGSVLTLSLVCSSIAYLLYFGLVASAGPSKTLTVTFLVPAFAMVWASLFLHEHITVQMLAGCALILSGTANVIGLFGKKKLQTGS